MTRTACLLALLTLAGCGPTPTPVAPDPPPRLLRTFALEGVGGPADGTGIPGRIDHLAYDPATARLFVCCVANGSLEVIDLESGTRAGRVPGLHEPQGAAVAGGSVYVATGGDGKLRRFDARTLAPQGSVAVGEDADNVRVAPDGRVWVSHAGGLSRFDAATLAPLEAIKLPRMPEGFRLDPAGHAFANLPAGKRSAADGTVLGLKLPGGEPLWERTLAGRAGNFPMAFDPAGGRLFVATRRPARLIVLDTREGAILGEAECPPESDDLFFDPQSGCVAVLGGGSPPGPGDAGGAGAALELIRVAADGVPNRVGRADLPPHARTGAIAPDRRTVYVAVPGARGRPAEVREYGLE